MKLTLDTLSGILAAAKRLKEFTFETAAELEGSMKSRINSGELLRALHDLQSHALVLRHTELDLRTE